MSNSRKRLLSQDEAEDYHNWLAPAVEGSLGIGDLAPGQLPTASQIQSLQKDAFEEAKQEGYQAGYEKGLESARADMRKSLSLLDGYISLMQEPLKKLDEDVEDSIVKLSLLIASQIIRRELKTEPGEVIAVVREAIRAIPGSNSRSRIFLNPEDAKLVSEVLSIHDEDFNWRIEEDILLTRGDCRVETETSLIDATIESRLSATAAKLLGGERNSDE